MEQFHFQKGTWQTRPFCDIYSHTAQWEPPSLPEEMETDTPHAEAAAKLPLTPLATRKKLVRSRYMKTSDGHIIVAGREVATSA